MYSYYSIFAVYSTFRWITYPLREVWMGLVETLVLYLEIKMVACWSTWIIMVKELHNLNPHH